jgi:polyhydroxyalkanoate synthesis regulator phasin
MKEWVRKIEDGTQFALSQFRQAMDSSLQRMKETGEAHATHSREGMDRFQDQMKRIEENMVTLEEKIREGFAGVQDELGSMIKFSYSDLEKKLAALEVRVKTLEKMVLP